MHSMIALLSIDPFAGGGKRGFVRSWKKSSSPSGKAPSEPSNPLEAVALAARAYLDIQGSEATMGEVGDKFVQLDQALKDAGY